jgi:hypothetical protein
VFEVKKIVFFALLILTMLAVLNSCTTAVVKSSPKYDVPLAATTIEFSSLLKSELDSSFSGLDVEFGETTDGIMTLKMTKKMLPFDTSTFFDESLPLNDIEISDSFGLQPFSQTFSIPVVQNGYEQEISESFNFNLGSIKELKFKNGKFKLSFSNNHTNKITITAKIGSAEESVTLLSNQKGDLILDGLSGDFSNPNLSLTLSEAPEGSSGNFDITATLLPESTIEKIRVEMADVDGDLVNDTIEPFDLLNETLDSITLTSDSEIKLDYDNGLPLEGKITTTMEGLTKASPDNELDFEKGTGSSVSKLKTSPDITVWNDGIDYDFNLGFTTNDYDDTDSNGTKELILEDSEGFRYDSKFNYSVSITAVVDSITLKNLNIKTKILEGVTFNDIANFDTGAISLRSDAFETSKGFNAEIKKEGKIENFNLSYTLYNNSGVEVTPENNLSEIISYIYLDSSNEGPFDVEVDINTGGNTITLNKGEKIDIFSFIEIPMLLNLTTDMQVISQEVGNVDLPQDISDQVKDILINMKYNNQTGLSFKINDQEIETGEKIISNSSLGINLNKEQGYIEVGTLDFSILSGDIDVPAEAYLTLSLWGTLDTELNIPLGGE